MKTCKRCQEVLPLEAFHKHKGFKDGRRIICAKCSCKSSQKYYADNREKHMDLCRDWQKRNRDKVKEYNKSSRDKHKRNATVWAQNNPIRVKAQKTLNYAIFKGEVKRLDTCQVCGCNGCDIQGHHYDYSKPLEVIWVCTQCHGWIHRKRPVQEKAIA